MEELAYRLGRTSGYVVFFSLLFIPSYFIILKFRKQFSRKFILSLAIQIGLLIWFIIGALLTGISVGALLELLIFGVLIFWIFFRISKWPIILLCFFHGINCLLIFAINDFYTDISLIKTLILRLSAILFMILGYFNLRGNRILAEINENKPALFKRQKNKPHPTQSQEGDSPQKNHALRLYHGWNWLVWWKISSLALEYQLNNYDHLKISRSARGVSFVYCVVAGVMTIAGFCIKCAMLHLLPRDAAAIVSERFGIEDPLIDFLCITFVAGLIVLLGRLIYKGHRWAIVVMMALSTLNMLVQPKFIIFWTLSMHAFYAALKVENMRSQQKT